MDFASPHSLCRHFDGRLIPWRPRPIPAFEDGFASQRLLSIPPITLAVRHASASVASIRRRRCLQGFGLMGCRFRRWASASLITPAPSPRPEAACHGAVSASALISPAHFRPFFTRRDFQSEFLHTWPAAAQDGRERSHAPQEAAPLAADGRDFLSPGMPAQQPAAGPTLFSARGRFSRRPRFYAAHRQAFRFSRASPRGAPRWSRLGLPADADIISPPPLSRHR